MTTPLYPRKEDASARSHHTMAVRHLYVARHGDADAFGELTDTGREQARLLGRRLARVPVTTVWHSPLARARATAEQLDLFLNGNAPVTEAAELVDHVPYVPTPEETPQAWSAFFDGHDPAGAEAGHRIARSLVDRFAVPPVGPADLHEVLITHTYPIAWLVRHALGAPPVRWLGLNSANAALTVIECRPGLPPSLTMFNELGHLPEHLRWTGFPPAVRP